jgi:hypothetical protein
VARNGGGSAIPGAARKAERQTAAEKNTAACLSPDRAAPALAAYVQENVKLLEVTSTSYAIPLFLLILFVPPLH